MTTFKRVLRLKNIVPFALIAIVLSMFYIPLPYARIKQLKPGYL